MVVLQHRQQIRNLADQDPKCPGQLACRGCHGDSAVLIRLYRRGDRGCAAQGHGIDVDKTGGACRWRERQTNTFTVGSVTINSCRTTVRKYIYFCKSLNLTYAAGRELQENDKTVEF